MEYGVGMWIFYSGMSLVAVAWVTARQLVTHEATIDLAMPIWLSGAWAGGAMMILGLVLWCRQDLAERRTNAKLGIR